MDWVMVFFTVAGVAYIWLLIALPVWFKGYHREAVDYLLLILLVLLFATVLKFIIGRPRPEDVRTVYVPVESLYQSYSFPSGHASRGFAAALFLSYRFRRWTVPLYGYAILIGVSRIYVGAHYPSDVLGGAILGSLVALLVIWLASQPLYSGLRDRIVHKLESFRKEWEEE